MLRWFQQKKDHPDHQQQEQQAAFTDRWSLFQHPGEGRLLLAQLYSDLRWFVVSPGEISRCAAAFSSFCMFSLVFVRFESKHKELMGCDDDRLIADDSMFRRHSCRSAVDCFLSLSLRTEELRSFAVILWRTEIIPSFVCNGHRIVTDSSEMNPLDMLENENEPLMVLI